MLPAHMLERRRKADDGAAVALLMKVLMYQAIPEKNREMRKLFV